MSSELRKRIIIIVSIAGLILLGMIIARISTEQKEKAAEVKAKTDIEEAKVAAKEKVDDFGYLACVVLYYSSEELMDANKRMNKNYNRKEVQTIVNAINSNTNNKDNIWNFISEGAWCGLGQDQFGITRIYLYFPNETLIRNGIEASAKNRMLYNYAAWHCMACGFTVENFDYLKKYIEKEEYLTEVEIPDSIDSGFRFVEYEKENTIIDNTQKEEQQVKEVAVDNEEPLKKSNETIILNEIPNTIQGLYEDRSTELYSVDTEVKNDNIILTISGTTYGCNEFEYSIKFYDEDGILLGRSKRDIKVSDGEKFKITDKVPLYEGTKSISITDYEPKADETKSNTVYKKENTSLNSSEMSTYKMINYRMDYVLPASTYRYLEQEDLKGLDAEQARIARNEIYATYGRRFTSEDLKTYFSSRSWYNPRGEASVFDEAVLNKYAKENIKLIKQYEDDGCPYANDKSSITMRTVGFISGDEHSSNDIYLEYISDTEGRFVLVMYEEDEKGNIIKDECYCYKFSEDGFGNGQVYTKSGEQLDISYNIVYEIKDYDEYHYAMYLNYFGENWDLLELSWACKFN